MGKQQLIEIQPADKRAALREAIHDRDETERIANSAKVALDRAAGLVAEAENHADAVTAALASVRDGRASRLREAAQGGNVIEVAASSREARFAEDDARDDLATAKSVLAGCQAAFDEAFDDARRAQRRLSDYVDRFMVAAADQVIADVAVLRQKLDARFSVLKWLEHLAPFGTLEHARIHAATPAESPPGVAPVAYPTPEEWVPAREALMRDASAALPTSTK